MEVAEVGGAAWDAWGIGAREEGRGDVLLVVRAVVEGVIRIDEMWLCRGCAICCEGHIRGRSHCLGYAPILPVVDINLTIA